MSLSPATAPRAATVPRAERPKILCLDDEPRVLEALRDRLRRQYDVITMSNGFAALKELATGEIPVVISDMRMPLLDGARFLTLARQHAPDTVRLVLTGQADVDAAIEAVNGGQIFRFLVKPCAQEVLVAAIEDAIEQHRLRTSERVLLEETLRGAISTMVEVLTLADPAAFGRATRIRQRVTSIARRAGVELSWELVSAALLSQLGSLTLSDADYERLPAAAERLLSHIPRLESVRQLLRHAGPAEEAGPAANGSKAANVLRVAIDYEVLADQGLDHEAAVATLRSRADRYDEHVLAALADALGADEEERELKEVWIRSLEEGMTLADDVMSTSGQLLVARGAPVNATLVARLTALGPAQVQQPLRVWRER
jgi:FixJ family two-component response regulator